MEKAKTVETAIRTAPLSGQWKRADSNEMPVSAHRSSPTAPTAPLDIPHQPLQQLLLRGPEGPLLDDKVSSHDVDPHLEQRIQAAVDQMIDEEDEEGDVVEGGRGGGPPEQVETSRENLSLAGRLASGVIAEEVVSSSLSRSDGCLPETASSSSAGQKGTHQPRPQSSSSKESQKSASQRSEKARSSSKESDQQPGRHRRKSKRRSRALQQASVGAAPPAAPFVCSSRALLTNGAAGRAVPKHFNIAFGSSAKSLVMVEPPPRTSTAGEQVANFPSLNLTTAVPGIAVRRASTVPHDEELSGGPRSDARPLLPGTIADEDFHDPAKKQDDSSMSMLAATYEEDNGVRQHDHVRTTRTSATNLTVPLNTPAGGTTTRLSVGDHQHSLGAGVSSSAALSTSSAMGRPSGAGQEQTVATVVRNTIMVQGLVKSLRARAARYSMAQAPATAGAGAVDSTAPAFGATRTTGRAER